MSIARKSEVSKGLQQEQSEFNSFGRATLLARRNTTQQVANAGENLSCNESVNNIFNVISPAMSDSQQSVSDSQKKKDDGDAAIEMFDGLKMRGSQTTFKSVSLTSDNLVSPAMGTVDGATYDDGEAQEAPKEPTVKPQPSFNLAGLKAIAEIVAQRKEKNL